MDRAQSHTHTHITHTSWTSINLSDALIKAAPKTKKTAVGEEKAAAASSVKKNGKVKAAAAKKKPTLAKKTIAIKKTGRNSIRKSAIGGRSKAMMGGGRAVGMAIDQVVRGGGRRASSARVTTTPNKATINDAPTKLLVSNLDFNVTEKDIKVCSSGEETIIHQNNYFDEEEEKEKEKEGRRRTLLLLLRTARRRTTLSIFVRASGRIFQKKKPLVPRRSGDNRERTRRDLRSKVKCKIDKDNNRVGN